MFYNLKEFRLTLVPFSEEELNNIIPHFEKNISKRNKYEARKAKFSTYYIL